MAVGGVISVIVAALHPALTVSLGSIFAGSWTAIKITGAFIFNAVYGIIGFSQLILQPLAPFLLGDLYDEDAGGRPPTSLEVAKGVVDLAFGSASEPLVWSYLLVSFFFTAFAAFKLFWSHDRAREICGT
jgi:hypothetical protein